MKTRLIPALLISALWVAPAFAQAIYEAPETVIITPRSNYVIPRAYDIPADQKIGSRTMNAPNSWTAGEMQRMEGKRVVSSRGEELGTIMNVDIAGQLVQVHTPGGVSVAIPLVLLQDKGDRLYAPTTSEAQFLAMAVRQTGTTIASDVNPNQVASAE